MKYLRVLLDIPDYIQKGLDSGRMVRHAGTVRRAPGMPNGGDIVAHLNEVGAMRLETVILPTAGLMAVQAISTAYLARRLDVIEGHLLAMRAQLQGIGEVLERITDNQMIAMTSKVSCGMELLWRALPSKASMRLEPAMNAFIECQGNTRHWLLAQNGESLLEQAPALEHVLTADATAVVGELVCMSYLGLPYADQAECLHRREDLWGQIATRLEEVPATTKRIPTRVTLQRFRVPIGKWKRGMIGDLRTGAEIFLAKGSLCLALGGMSPDERDRLADSLKANARPMLVVIPKTSK